jgi:hypothetical protein
MSDVKTGAVRLSSLELTEEIIRRRAYAYFERRGREDGHALEDWVTAEAAIRGHRNEEPKPEPVAPNETAAAA